MGLRVKLLPENNGDKIMRDENQKQLNEIPGRERYYRFILNNMHEAIMVIDRNYRVDDVNKTACKMYKKQRGELIGRYCYEVSHMYDRPCSEMGLQCPLHRAFKTGLPVKALHRHKLTDGTSVWEDILASPLKDDKGRIIYIIEAMRDVTELLKMHQRLQETLKGTIHSLATVVEMRDPYTAGHQRRVSQLACAIATEMGLSKEQTEGIKIAGLLHDIGKISVPAEILSKPGRLSESEFSIIKEHPQVGHDILKDIKFEWPIAQIILQHHERMDGSGYPKGLSGEDILLEARILGVADTVEAMSSHRPYRPALGIDKALEEIQQNKGVLYDPKVVDACVKLFVEKGFKLK